jgi:hypothetical protein
VQDFTAKGGPEVQQAVSSLEQHMTHVDGTPAVPVLKQEVVDVPPTQPVAAAEPPPSQTTTVPPSSEKVRAGQLASALQLWPWMFAQSGSSHGLPDIHSTPNT